MLTLAWDDSYEIPERATLRAVDGEPDQVPRLLRVRERHPDVIIGRGGFGTWQALIPEPNGQIVITRYDLGDLLDKLEELGIS
jgi:hypothetical protein